MHGPADGQVNEAKLLVSGGTVKEDLKMRKSRPNDYPEKYMAGGKVGCDSMKKMKSGGKVRGCGVAKKGTRPAKMR